MDTTATKADVEQLSKKLDGVDKNFDTKVTKLETKFDRLDAKVDSLDVKFEAKFDALDAKIDARHDELVDLLRGFMDQVSEELEKAHAERESIRRDINRILDHLDSIEKRLEISEDERLVMGHQLKRLQAWTEHLADKMGVDLDNIKV